ncbi:MAG: hypothetical protein J2P19_00350 [Pseudonocardia sp.]|nr:hypothetical protein [Pseudonocardia sp.]
MNLFRTPIGHARDLVTRMAAWVDDHRRVRRADRRVWGEPTTLAGVGQVTARWLEGEVRTSMGYGAGPDPETVPLIPVLARLNRAGFVTINSQPGETGDGYFQRAWVAGLADEATLARIIDAVDGTDLMLRYGFGRGAHRRYPRYPITVEGDSPETGWVCTSITCGLPRRDHDLVYECCSDAAYAAVMAAAQVDVVDPVWGRNDLLWPTLDAALTGHEGKPR